ncbi:MAG: signal peptidase I [Vallitaleaceae bacterium]|jgi:signal peptidase I|nr:signal peptidase I [Vallitaleaceae bacterium]
MTEKKRKEIIENDNNLSEIENILDEYQADSAKISSSNNNNKKKKKIKPEPSMLREVLTWIRDLGIAVILVLLILNFVGETTSIIGASMEPHIHDGDRFIINKLAYQFNEPERYDIVVFPYDDELNYIKRVIGMPGEEINLVQKNDGTYDLLINGEMLADTYGMEQIIRPGNQKYPLIIPKDEYFVMGDNRNDSSDSRYTDVGTIDSELIVGKTWVRIWPLSTFGTVE